MKNFEKNAAENPFFKKVWDSQNALADVAIPFWARAQKANAALTGAYADELPRRRRSTAMRAPRVRRPTPRPSPSLTGRPCRPRLVEPARREQPAGADANAETNTTSPTR